MQCAAPRRAERQSNMELLRIVAMLLVVIFHAACALDVSIPEGEFSVAHFFLRLCYAAGDLGNSLFILISGHFLVRSAFSLRRVLRLWAQTLFYSLLLGALALAAGRHFSAREALQVVAPVLSNSYWFITGYIAFSFFISTASSRGWSAGNSSACWRRCSSFSRFCPRWRRADSCASPS